MSARVTYRFPDEIAFGQAVMWLHRPWAKAQRVCGWCGATTYTSMSKAKQRAFQFGERVTTQEAA